MKTALGTKVEEYDAQPWARTFNMVMKVAIVVVFIVAIFVPLDHLEGKAMEYRVPLFVGAALVVPAIEYFKKTKRDPYPHIADGLLVSPFLMDTLGNVVGAYDKWSATDDFLHCINWILLVLAFQAFRFRRTADTREAILLGAGFGALAIVVWEIMEWIVDEYDWGGNLGLTYADTIGDLTLSTSGGIVGSILGVAVFAGAKRSGDTAG